MWIGLVAGLALGTLAFRLVGPIAGTRLELPDRLERLAGVAATIMLAALAVTAALSGESGGPPSAARILGFAAAAGLAWRRQPLPVVVITAAGVTACLRLLGVD